MKNGVWLTLVLALLSVPLFAVGVTATDEKAVIEKVIRANIGWTLTKGRPLAESTMVQPYPACHLNSTKAKGKAYAENHN